jgi:hypothetical protein
VDHGSDNLSVQPYILFGVVLSKSKAIYTVQTSGQFLLGRSESQKLCSLSLMAFTKTKMSWHYSDLTPSPVALTPVCHTVTWYGYYGSLMARMDRRRGRKE